MSKKLKKLAEKYQHPEGNDVYEALVVAYNQAIDDAANSAVTKVELGNPYDMESAYYTVDKDSILKLKVG